MVCYLVFLTVLISTQKSCCSKEVMNVGNILKEQPYFGKISMKEILKYTHDGKNILSN